MAGVMRVLSGLVLSGAGAVLLYQSLAIYDGRLKAAAAAPVPPIPAPVVATTTAGGSGGAALNPRVLRPSPAELAPMHPPASAAPSASASAAPAASVAPPPPSASAAAPVAGSSGDSDTFRFGAGGIVLPKDELARSVAFGGSLRKQDRPRIVIEGFGDVPGTGDTGTFLGRRRAMIVRQLFGDIGIDSERITLVAIDVATEPSLAGMVRIRPPPPPEVKKSP